MTSGIIFGCWDLFHVGHLNALEQCTKYVDTLYVGVFTDKAVLDYKGKLPIIPQDRRMVILSHICFSGCKILPFKIEKRAPRDWAIRYFFVSEKLRGKKLQMIVKENYHPDVIKYIQYTPEVSTTIIKDKVLKTAWSALDAN